MLCAFSTQYRVLYQILTYNKAMQLPTLKELATDLNGISRAGVKCCINELKNTGLIKQVGNRRSYSYYISELGLEKLHDLQNTDEMKMLLALYKLSIIGD